jgi:hypothetical protein
MKPETGLPDGRGEGGDAREAGGLAGVTFWLAARPGGELEALGASGAFSGSS